ncbi:amino acid adenylation domain-containing protein [Dactylosporangium sp. CS-033363]|uniref:amino acid adenylation domain-containing protein n=1 Tax=Dactylosporangium sp. CS-033363 TaxID=3239935 RepID=UPI003D8C68CC
MFQRVHEQVEAQARRTPDRVAVIAGAVRMRYAELDARANRIARVLAAAGAGPGALVGVCLGRDEHLLPALLGVLKTGAAYVPMDPAYPAERLAYIAADTKMRLVATTRGTALPGLDAVAVHVDEIAADADATPLERPGDGSDAAYVIYTSGSTGRPKGVVVEHRNTMNLLRYEAGAYTAEELSGMLATASICFDPSITQLFLPLATGGTVILAENVLALPALPARDEVRTVYGVPSALAALLREPLPDGVRAVFAGGEPLTRALVERIYANPGVRRVLNLYGPTECTTTCAIAEVGRDDTGEPPIGQAIAGAVLSVRDGDGRPVGDGELGELWIGGPVVARGYLNRDRGGFGDGWYRSGDLVRADGAVLRFAGRADDQVKIRGYRVEPGEVEAVLAGHPAVRRAAVVAAADGDGVSYLVGHVEATGLDERDLRAWLRRRVPEHLVPTRFAIGERLPLSPNGKIDRVALPALAARRAEETEFVAPRTPVEERLAAIVGGVLGIDEIGVDDRFTDLGGHSLAAARVCALAGREYATTVPLAGFLADPTVAALAALIRTTSTPAAGGPVRHEGVLEYPLTPTQRGLWTLRQLGSVPQATTVAFRVRLTGPVEVPALRSALAAVVSRHEVLRSRIVERDGEPIAVVGGWTDVPVIEHDLRDGPAAAIARHAFDLTGTEPLLRVALIRLAKDLSELVVVADHLAFDGWSTGAFLTELATELAAPGTVAPPPVQVGDLALTQHGATDAWRDELAGASPPSELFSGTGSFHGERITRPVPNGAAAFADWLSALGLLLAGLTARRDVLVGVVAARRAGPELDRVIGPLVDVLPIRLRLDPAATVRTTVAAASAATARALDRPRPSTDELFAAVGSQSRGSMLTPVVLSVQPAGMPVRVERDGVRLELLGELGCGGAQNPLTVFVNETADGVELQVEYDTGLTTRAWVEAFADRLLRTLAEVTADPDRPLHRVPLVTPAEEAHLLDLAAGPPIPEGAPATAVEAIERQVRQRPDEVAVVGADGEMTFRQLWDDSAAIAAILLDRGIEQGDVVGVCLPRDHRVPATLLGVWRAGAAYLPLEPELPPGRLAWLVADGGATTVLCRTTTASAAGPAALDLDRTPAAVAAVLPVVGPEDRAYLLYTSGSTGKPKGVAVAQSSLAALTEALRVEPGLGPGDRMLAVATLSFDVSCAEIWSSLGTGASCVVVDRDSAVDGYRLRRQIAEHRVTVMNVPPTILRTLLAAGWTGGDDLRVWAAGETLDPALARELLPLVGELWNTYGPTEATVLSTAYRVHEVGEAVPIGHAMPGERLYVMDALDRLVPAGVPGELWIGGAGPAIGYHNRQDLTAAAFVPDPVVPGGRCYRTGDLVHRRADGEIVFVGRRDHQLKIRGYRVELGEIEAVLRAHPDVEHAVVVARGQGAEAHLIGYVAGPVTADQAADHLRAHLPAYLVPHRWVVLGALPMTPSGKVDLGALPEPGEDRPHRPAESVMEQLVADVWAQILTTDRIGADDSFFGLGGHSLAATRAVGRLRETLGCAVPVRLLFDHPVLASFAGQLERLVMDEIVAEPATGI